MNRKGLEKKPKIPRPLNAFMLFANDNRAQYRKAHPGETNSRISVRLGEAWKQLNGKEKTQYYHLSKKAELEHHTKYPDYIYTPTEARSNKKSRRLSKNSPGEECTESKQHDNGGDSHHPLVSVSDENCSPPNNISPRPYGYADWKYDPYYPNYSHCQNGQGDQMAHYQMPYGTPPFMSPFGYPRFPGWDFRPHPYMGAQYGRMPFVPPSMVYQCPPHQLSQYVTPAVQPVEGKIPVNYLPHMQGYYSHYQPDMEPPKKPTEEKHTEKQHASNESTETVSKPEATTERRATETHVQVSAYQQYHDQQLKQAEQVQDAAPPMQHQNDTTTTLAGSALAAQAERYQPAVQNPVTYIYYGTDQQPQPYVLDGSRPVPQYVRIATEPKTFADLSTGQPEIVKVATHPPH